MTLIDTKVERVLIKGGKADEAKRNNIILLAKELAIETDTYKMKLGDGISPYNKLPYLPYTVIDVIQIAKWNTAYLNSLSWITSAASTITSTDIANWNSGSLGVSVVDLVATMNIPAFSVVTSQGRVADSSTASDRDKIVGINPSAIANGFNGQVQMIGEIANPAWTFTTGQIIFLNGTSLSATPPSSGFVMKVATAKSATQLIIELGISVLL